ncbi:MAG TPA: extracellular solute-binding protein [Anaerolineaceae bacterium]|nr:extracellular solute-binding protein [Anaerolineaceae bacterium]
MRNKVSLLISILVVLGLLLTACAAPAAQPTNAAPEGEQPAGEQPAGEKPFDGVTINIMMEGVPDTEFVQELLPQFQEETGMTVNIEVLNYALMHEKLVPQLTAGQGSGSYDAIVVDNYWVGEFVGAGWLMPLDDRLAASESIKMENYLPSMVEMVGELNGQTYMVPFYNYAMALIYRTDVMEDAEVQAAYKEATGNDLALPASIPEYVELAKFMTRDTDGDGEVDFYGNSMQGLRPDPTVMEFLNYLYAMGGSIYAEDGSVAINNEIGVEALTLYADAMANAAPPGAPAYGFDEAYATMAQGDAFSYISYNWMVPQLNDPEKSQVVDKVAVVRVPGGAGLLGGWGWAIPNSSPNPDAAWAFFEWVESFEIAKERALLGGAPTRHDVFADADVLAKYAHYSEVEQIVGEAIMFPILSRAPQVVEVLGIAISGVTSGETTVEAALETAAAELENLKDK